MPEQQAHGQVGIVPCRHLGKAVEWRDQNRSPYVSCTGQHGGDGGAETSSDYDYLVCRDTFAQHILINGEAILVERLLAWLARTSAVTAIVCHQHAPSVESGRC